MEEEIKIINDIIYNAVKHGADPGGSYESNLEGLTESIEHWIRFHELEDNYYVEEIPIIDEEERSKWVVPQIVEDKVPW